MEISLIILIPLYILYILFIGRLMFLTRMKALKEKNIKSSYLKAYQGDVPERLTIVKNHYENQFQVPVLFFITVLSTVLLQATSILSVILGYLFIVSRIAHSYFHLGSNQLKKRALSYTIGLIIVLMMWVLIIKSFIV